jgi:DNA-binding XRE family transcriptional regulator
MVKSTTIRTNIERGKDNESWYLSLKGFGFDMSTRIKIIFTQSYYFCISS